jgi:hypothetical protein
MATMILLPNADGAVSLQWTVVGLGISEMWEALDDDNDGASYAKCSADTRTMVIEYADPSVAAEDIASIDSVRFLSSGKGVHRTDPSLVDISFEAPTAGFSETASYDAHRTNYETINGTARTTSDGSNAWTYHNLQALEMLCTKNGAVEIYLSYLALEVTYTPAVAADNATFFGANF